MLNRGMIFNAWQRVVPNVRVITYYSRGGSIQGNGAALGPDAYFQYSVRAAKKQYKQEEADLSGIIAPSGDDAFQIWQEFIDSAIPMNSAPLPMPAPKIEDYLVDVDGRGWTVSKINKQQLFGVVFELVVINRN